MALRIRMLRQSISKDLQCQNWHANQSGSVQENRHLFKYLQWREFKPGDWLYDTEIKLGMMKQCRNWDQQEATVMSARGKKKGPDAKITVGLFGMCKAIEHTVTAAYVTQGSKEGNTLPFPLFLPSIIWPAPPTGLTRPAGLLKQCSLQGTAMVDKNSRERVRLDSGQIGSGPVMHLWETVNITNVQ